MRTLFLAAVAWLLVVADASAEYRRLPGPPADVNVGVALQRDDVLVAAGGVLTAHAPDGSTRVLKLPKGQLKFMQASDQAVSVEMHNHAEYAALNGRRWRKLGGLQVSGSVSGPYATVLREDRYEDKSTLRVIDLRTGTARRFRINEERAVGVQIVGDYLAYYTHFAVIGRETVVVRRLSTGREVYRREFGRVSRFQLLPGGKVVVSTPGTYDNAYFVRIHERGRWRTIREVSAMLTGGIVATPEGIAMLRRDAQDRTDVWLLGYDGRMRALTPLVAGIDGLLFNGRRLVFSIEGCIFTGPIPAPGAPLPPVSNEGCVRPGRDG